MNKNKLLGILLLIISIAAVTFFVQSNNSSDVDFTLANHVEGVIILPIGQEMDTTSTELDSSRVVSLDHGSYEVLTQGKNAVSTSYFIEVPNDNAVVVNPNYSRQYLQELLESERTEIIATIEGRLDDLLNGYTINKGELMRQGDWYTTVLYKTIDDPRQEPDTYRILLEKQNDSWTLVSGPKIILTVHDYPTIPVDILTEANEAVFNFSEAL